MSQITYDANVDVDATLEQLKSEYKGIIAVGNRQWYEIPQRDVRSCKAHISDPNYYQIKGSPCRACKIKNAVSNLDVNNKLASANRFVVIDVDMNIHENEYYGYGFEEVREMISADLPLGPLNVNERAHHVVNSNLIVLTGCETDTIRFFSMALRR